MTKYVPVRSMWLTRVFLDLASQNERNCLTIDCTNVNPNGPGWYRTKAGNPEKQVCYFNETRSDQVWNIFVSKRIKGGNFEKKFILQLIAFKARSTGKLLMLRNFR